ncbi:ricin B lectin domain-containing protein [Rhizoctonia solani]|nr:ricin B lectin domain-containing protein [Rhizoctonia solani]
MSQQSLPAGTYTLKNVSTGTVLDLWDGRSDEGTAIQGFNSHGGDNQKWRLKWTGKGNQVTLQNVKGGTYVGIESSNNIQNSVKVVGSKTAVPLIVVAADKGFAIEAADHRLFVLDLKESNPANETPVIYFNNNATDNQKWYFEKV